MMRLELLSWIWVYLWILCSLASRNCAGNSTIFRREASFVPEYSNTMLYENKPSAVRSTPTLRSGNGSPWEPASQRLEQPKNRKEIRLPGDIILGGLFPMHESGTGGKVCGAIKVEKGIQRVEAMLFAIKEINKDYSLLRQYNLTVGAHILDTCLRDTYALEQSLDFIKDHINTLDGTEYTCPGGDTPISTKKEPVVGVIGAAASPVSIMVANILRLFQIPQISYASTGIELSDKSRFDFFSRVVPPDTFQAQAMVDIVKEFGWTYVSTVADEGNYGEKGIAAFEHRADQDGICVEKSLQIPREIRENTFTNIIKQLRHNSKAKVVVLFVNEDYCKRLINASIVMGTSDYFHWLASDSWGAKRVPVNGQEWAALGAVTILPMRKQLDAFNRYFTSLTPDHKEENPWFDEFWESKFHCSFSPDPSDTTTHRCTGQESIGKDSHFTQEGIVPFVVDAVYAMVHAMNNLIAHECDGQLVNCTTFERKNGTVLLQYIRNVTFRGASGPVVRFNENGDGIGRYSIFQFQRHGPDGYSYKLIGNWTDDGLHLDKSLLRWNTSSSSIPRSVCSEPCKPGQITQLQGSSACCWICMNCLQHQILVNDSVCVDCPNRTYPDETKQICERLKIQFMTLENPWAIIPVVFAVMGVVSTLFVLLVFVRFNTTPVIMASGRELCYVSMVGLLMSYVMTFIMVSRPTTLSCSLMRVGLGLSLCICYSALLTKTNRISRIFNRGVKAMVKRPSYTSPRSQLVICLCLVLVQIIGAVTWVGMDLPGTSYYLPDRKTVILRCCTTNVAIVLSLLYNMILILMCTVYAFKTRKIPENFNEAKYIAFTMYSTCIVWLAFIPIYFGTSKSDFRVKITALCMCVSISATVQLGCLYLPKVYIVLFQPHKNVRQGSKGGGPGRPFFGRQSTRFSSLSAMTNGTIASPTGLALLIAQGSNKSQTAMSESKTKVNTDDDEEDASKSDAKCLDDLNSSDKDSDMETNV